jgi:hypothetical protein
VPQISELLLNKGYEIVLIARENNIYQLYRNSL